MKPSSTKDIYDLLDSDDEVPSDYDEIPFEPAYKNDDRFSNAIFNLMNIGRKGNDTAAVSSKATQIKMDMENKWLTKGVLNNKDVFCSKCVEMSDGASLLWFVNFLTLKDMQSNYNFLKSCLVPQLTLNNLYAIDTTVCDNSKKYQIITF